MRVQGGSFVFTSLSGGGAALFRPRARRGGGEGAGAASSRPFRLGSERVAQSFVSVALSMRQRRFFVERFCRQA